jgi:uncharacterized membrane protein YciS (DUF1049 family)
MSLISTLILVATTFLLGLFIGGILVFGVYLDTRPIDLEKSWKRFKKQETQ